MAKCNSCGATIFWAYTPEGKSMPIDQQQHPDGNVSLDDNGLVEIVQDPADRDRLRRHHGRKFHRPHFATCPDADEHRRRRG